MRTITQFINESKLSDKVFCEQFSVMFKGTKLNKDTIKIILGNLNKDFIELLSNSFANNDSTNYLAYQPNDDLFINYEDNKEMIINQISEYILKYKVQ